MSDLVKQLRQEASKNGNRQSDTAFTNRQRKKFRYRNHLLNNAADRIEELESRLEAVTEKGRYFIAEFEEDWEKGQVSIDTHDACQAFKAALQEGE